MIHKGNVSKAIYCKYPKPLLANVVSSLLSIHMIKMQDTCLHLKTVLVTSQTINTVYPLIHTHHKYVDKWGERQIIMHWHLKHFTLFRNVWPDALLRLRCPWQHRYCHAADWYSLLCLPSEIDVLYVCLTLDAMLLSAVTQFKFWLVCCSFFFCVLSESCAPWMSDLEMPAKTHGVGVFLELRKRLQTGLLIVG